MRIQPKRRRDRVGEVSTSRRGILVESSIDENTFKNKIRDEKFVGFDSVHPSFSNQTKTYTILTSQVLETNIKSVYIRIYRDINPEPIYHVCLRP